MVITPSHDKNLWRIFFSNYPFSHQNHPYDVSNNFISQAVRVSPTSLSLRSASWFSSSSRWPTVKNCQLRTCESSAHLRGGGSTNSDRFYSRGGGVRMLHYLGSSLFPDGPSELGCRFMYFYHWFAGAEHAAPHDGGPGAAHLITAGDHHHRQGAGLDQHRSRQSLGTAALPVAGPLLTLRALTWMVHSRPACRKSVTNLTRWSSSVTPTRVW